MLVNPETEKEKKFGAWNYLGGTDSLPAGCLAAALGFSWFDLRVEVENAT